jgi:hypothetical protein
MPTSRGGGRPPSPNPPGTFGPATSKQRWFTIRVPSHISAHTTRAPSPCLNRVLTLTSGRNDPPRNPNRPFYRPNPPVTRSHLHTHSTAASRTRRPDPYGSAADIDHPHGSSNEELRPPRLHRRSPALRRRHSRRHPRTRTHLSTPAVSWHASTHARPSSARASAHLLHEKKLKGRRLPRDAGTPCSRHTHALVRRLLRSAVAWGRLAGGPMVGRAPCWRRSPNATSPERAVAFPSALVSLTSVEPSSYNTLPPRDRVLRTQFRLTECKAAGPPKSPESSRGFPTAIPRPN